MSESAWRFAILGYPVGFGAPEWLALGLVAALVGVLAVVMAYRRRVRVRALLGARHRDERSQSDTEINERLGRAEQTLQHDSSGMRVPYRSELRFYNLSLRLEWSGPPLQCE